MSSSFEHQLHTFDSGLRLVTAPMQGTKTVTVYVLVGTGSKYESKDINGISHFLEHMMFKGTTKRPHYLDISRELDGIGAAYNAFTSHEYTGYYAKASAEKLGTAMDVVFDIFLNSTFNEDAIKTERHVVVEEIHMYKDDPRSIVAEHFEKLMYGDQPAGWSVAGEEKIVLGLNRDQFVDYFNSHYIASNTVVAVAGAIDPEKVKKSVSEYFKHIRTAEKVKKLPVIEQQTEPAVDLYFKETDQTHFIMGFRAYNMHDDRRYALSVLATILGGGMSSRLFDEVREKRGLAYYVSAGQSTSTDTGYLEVDAGVNNAKVNDAIEAIVAEVKKIKQEGVTPDELQRAKDQTTGRTALALEGSDTVASICASSLLFHDKVLTPEEDLAKIKAVTLDDILHVAGDVFREDKMNLALVGPFKESEPFKKLLKL